MELLLSFHTQRTVPLSDLLPRGGKVFLSSETTGVFEVRVISTHGTPFFETLRLEKTPVEVPYAPPWGVNWVVLELVSLEPQTNSEEPHCVKMRIEKIDCWGRS